MQDVLKQNVLLQDSIKRIKEMQKLYENKAMVAAIRQHQQFVKQFNPMREMLNKHKQLFNQLKQQRHFLDAISGRHFKEISQRFSNRIYSLSSHIK